MRTPRIEVHEARTEVVACTLDAAGAAGQLERWAALAPHVRSVDPIDAGARVVMAVGADAALREVAAAESACCGFLRIAITPDPVGDEVVLELTGAPDAQPVIAALVAAIEGSG